MLHRSDSSARLNTLEYYQSALFQYVPLFIERTKPVPPIAQIQSNRYPTALVLFSHKAKSLSERSRVQRPSPSHLIWLAGYRESSGSATGTLSRPCTKLNWPYDLTSGSYHFVF